MINKEQMSQKLATLSIEALAAKYNFGIHAEGLVKATDFILSFWLMFTSGKNTLKDWAIEWSKIAGHVFSKGLIHSRLQIRQRDFVEAVLKSAMGKAIYEGGIEGLSSSLLSSFNRVFIEDSMCLNLPSNLSKAFPGAFSKTGEAATARIQARLELKTGNITRLEVASFRDSDAKFSPDILHGLQAGDLVVRDLGYWKLSVFQLIAWMNAFFLTRYRYKTVLLDPISMEKIDLNAQLKAALKKGKTMVEMEVLVGKKDKLPARLVCIKAPQKVVQQRRRKAAKNRDKRLNYSKEYMELLGWTIFITNVDKEIWTPTQMLQVYGFRWRIEIIFKSWKSHLKFQELFKKKQSLTTHRAVISIFLILLWICLFFMPKFCLFLTKVFEKTQRFVSILKFADFFKTHFVQIVEQTEQQLDFFFDLAAKHTVYDKRKNVPNFCLSLYVLNF